MGAVLKLGRSEMKSGGRRKQALLGDAMEAVIAAVYLDAGFEAAREMILRLWGTRIEHGQRRCARCQDGVAGMGAGRGRVRPTIPKCATGRIMRLFSTIEVRLNGRAERAKAGSKRQAEQAAAEALLTVTKMRRQRMTGPDLSR